MGMCLLEADGGKLMLGRRRLDGLPGALDSV